MRNYVESNPSLSAVYQEIERRLDLVNFVDYLLPLVYADTDDWPHNNWRAARERVPGGRFRFYVWDAEWSFGYNNTPSHNTLSGQLSSFSPPWGTTEIQRLYVKLRSSPEFRLLFADASTSISTMTAPDRCAHPQPLQSVEGRGGRHHQRL